MAEETECSAFDWETRFAANDTPWERPLSLIHI